MAFFDRKIYFLIYHVRGESRISYGGDAKLGASIATGGYNQ